MSAPRVTVTIDRLVLRGIAAEQRAGIAAALTAELQRQLAAPGAIASLGASRSLASAPHATLSGGDGTTLGQGVAMHLSRNLRR